MPPRKPKSEKLEATEQASLVEAPTIPFEPVQMRRVDPAILADSDRQWAKSVNFAMGVDQIGNRLSYQAKRPGEIEVFDHYIEMVSKKNGRRVRVYSSNIKAIELF